MSNDTPLPRVCSRCGGILREGQVCEERRLVRIVSADEVEEKTRPRMLCPICRKAEKKRQ